MTYNSAFVLVSSEADTGNLRMMTLSLHGHLMNGRFQPRFLMMAFDVRAGRFKVSHSGKRLLVEAIM
ncbi:hypothetical protein KCP69_26975 (plasmid) [Salmonella enterica subsp. enterica]|nr:hypothetical protein KCP69_26975 [Salmonella enterica subsp. enterica]